MTTRCCQSASNWRMTAVLCRRQQALATPPRECGAGFRRYASTDVTTTLRVIHELCDRRRIRLVQVELHQTRWCRDTASPAVFEHHSRRRFAAGFQSWRQASRFTAAPLRVTFGDHRSHPVDVRAAPAGTIIATGRPRCATVTSAPPSTRFRYSLKCAFNSRTPIISITASMWSQLYMLWSHLVSLGSCRRADVWPVPSGSWVAAVPGSPFKSLSPEPLSLIPAASTSSSGSL